MKPKIHNLFNFGSMSLHPRWTTRAISRSLLLPLAVALLSAATGQAQPVVVTPLHGFTSSPDGAAPVGNLIFGTDNAIYGTTCRGGTNLLADGGTLFKLNRDGSGYSILRSFSKSDTGNSSSFTVMGLSVARGSDGTLYGITEAGGTNGAGTVFKLLSDGSGFAVLHNFTSTDGHPLNLIQGRDGMLYGAGYTALFKLDTNGNNYAVLHNYTNLSAGNASFGKLVQGTDGVLYGTAYQNGPSNSGTIFKLNPADNVFTVLHTFPSGTGDGIYPYAGLTQGSDGALYGTTQLGDTNGLGTVFKLGTDGSGYQVLHHFAGLPDGSTPDASLVPSLGNALYGTTYAGGAGNLGTIFTINLDGSGYNVLYSFTNSAIGWKPIGGLVQGPASGGSGVFYGTTSFGPTSNLGGGAFAMLVNPPLTITPVVTQAGSNQVLVTWPAWALTYVLQTTTNLAVTNWGTASNGVPMVSVLLTNNLPASYYRLVWPQ